MLKFRLTPWPLAILKKNVKWVGEQLPAKRKHS